MCIFCESVHNHKNASLPSDFGKFVMKSIDISSHISLCMCKGQSKPRSLTISPYLFGTSNIQVTNL
jgi:hypothetical protein